MKSLVEHLSLATSILGRQVSPAALNSEAVHETHKKINLNSLIEVLRSYGFENSISKRDLTDIPSLTVPVVLLLKEDEAVVLTKIEGKGKERIFYVRYHDGLEDVLDYSKLMSKYIGYCWFLKLKTTSDLRSELPEYKLPKSWFWKVIWRFKRYYYNIIVATFIINVLALVSSLYVMNVYDRVIPNRAYETLWVLSIGVILAITFEFIAKLIRARLTDIAGKKADLIISSALFRRVLALKLSEKPASSGSYANNLRDFESVRDFMTSASLLVLVDFPFLLMFLFVLYLIAGKLVLVPIFLIPIILVVSLLAQKPLAKYINESMKEGSQRQGLAVEAIEGIETLKANNATNWAQKKWDSFTAKTAASSIKVKNISNFVVNFSVGMQQLNTVFLVLYGTYLIHSDNPSSKITMGALIASVILSGRALSPLAQVAGLAIRFQQAKLALDGVNAIIERPIERIDEKNYISPNKIQGKIVFNNVSFSYQEDMKPVLSKLKLEIGVGEKVAILGKIGSGKSTLLKLATGLYEAGKGSITIDNIDIRQIDPNFLRNQLSLLNQSPRLFLGTLRENLEMGCSDGFYSDEDLLQALNRFGLADIIQSHPRGLDMGLGEDGSGLSGGQKQIVSLARLTLRRPQIVLLDEPTSGLDQMTEVAVLNSLLHWTKDKTMVVVTHRTQVLNIVERIVVVENGKVVMDGPRDDVMKGILEANKSKENSQ